MTKPIVLACSALALCLGLSLASSARAETGDAMMHKDAMHKHAMKKHGHKDSMHGDAMKHETTTPQ